MPFIPTLGRQSQRITTKFQPDSTSLAIFLFDVVLTWDEMGVLGGEKLYFSSAVRRESCVNQVSTCRVFVWTHSFIPQRWRWAEDLGSFQVLQEACGRVGIIDTPGLAKLRGSKTAGRSAPAAHH